MRDTTRPSSTWRSSTQPGLDVERVTSQYCDPVYRFLYSRVGNREDAEDLTSEVFLKATRQLDGSRAEASVGQWLFTVARTVLADHWRRHYRYAKTVYPDDVGMDELPERPRSAESKAMHETLIQQVLESLPDRDRRVLELRFLHGYSIEATAQELGTTPESVKVTQHRALAGATQMVEGER